MLRISIVESIQVIGVGVGVGCRVGVAMTSIQTFFLS